jgi:uncharacterized membrane protein YidH (DUF202 family)
MNLVRPTMTRMKMVAAVACLVAVVCFILYTYVFFDPSARAPLEDKIRYVTGVIITIVGPILLVYGIVRAAYKRRTRKT